MSMFLEFHHGGKLLRHELADAATIGRHRGCDVVLDSESVSRRHARVTRDGDHYFVEDLGSRNGTTVNGVATAGRAELAHGDVIGICDFQLRLADPAEESPDLPLTMLESPSADQKILSAVDATAAACSVDPEAALDAVLAVTRALGTHLDLDSLLPLVLRAVFDVYPHVDRGVILLIDDNGELQPMAMRSRSGDGTNLVVSRTVLARALDERRAILSTDVAVDAQFAGSQSLVNLPIRSLMCVPLLGRSGEPLGLIELHTEVNGTPFTEHCLEVLVSVASAAAVAVDNALLHGRLLDQDRLQRDLAHARGVQRGFLPARLPEIAGYEFFSHYEAAQAIGGDYVGFIELPNARIAVGIGDVSGKGLPAALMMARLSSDVRFGLLQHQDPGKALAVVQNSLLQAGLDDRFVTFALMVVDTARHRMVLANAGHQVPLLRHADGRVEPVEVGQPGVPLNVSEDVDLLPVAGEVEIPEGAVVVAYTDGLSEAADPTGAFYGEERIAGIVGRTPGPATAVGEALVRDVTEFRAGREPRDDTTLVCFGRA